MVLSLDKNAITATPFLTYTTGRMLIRCQACVNRPGSIPGRRLRCAIRAITVRICALKNFATTRGEPRAMATTTEKVQENGKVNGARELTTICGFCGVGCGLSIKVEDGVIQKVTGEKENPSSKGEACIKGREGWRHLYSDRRLTTPLIRKD